MRLHAIIGKHATAIAVAFSQLKLMHLASSSSRYSHFGLTGLRRLHAQTITETADKVRDTPTMNEDVRSVYLT